MLKNKIYNSIMKVIYFTATGNSLYVTKKLGGTLFSIPQMIKFNQFTFEDEDIIGLVVPIHGFFIPSKIIKFFLNKIKLSCKYFFVIGTYGDRYGNFSELTQKYFTKKGIKVNYINTIKMVDNFLPGYEAKNQIETLDEKHVDLNLDKIITDINNHVEFKIFSFVGREKNN